MKYNLLYSDLKNIVLSKNLQWQFRENAKKYEIFIADGQIIYQSEIWKDGFEPEGIDAVANELDCQDFENNYKSGGNKKIEMPVKFLSTPIIGIKPKVNIGPRSWTFSHNFCDPTTWFGDSIRITNEVIGTGNGILGIFNLDNSNVIDIVHGKVTDEDNLDGNYKLVVKINGVVKTEREFGKTTGGDYLANYNTGQITFFIPPAIGDSITADYSYNNGSTMYIRPKPGLKTVITWSECQFSKDLIMNDNLISAVFTYNPTMGAPPAKFEYPNSRSRYKRMYDFINYTNGSFPIIPSMGGSARGLSNDILQLKYEYTSAIELPSSAGAEIRVWLENNISFGGEIAAITFYGYEESES